MRLAGISRGYVGLVLWGAAIFCGGQATPGAATGSAPSATVEPAAASVQQALETLRVDKWKAARDVRDAEAKNVDSLRRDLTTTLPSLMTAADAAPESISAMLPLSRNLGALYDVLLRVTVVAESAAPREQTVALEQAMTSVEGVRRMLADRLQSAASAEEQRVSELQKAVVAAKAVAVAPCPPLPAAPVKTATPVRRKKKPVAKPTATQVPGSKQ
jgi:hypothetical protein